ncbi:DUF4199 domain-containing protein [Flavobacteriaceae bacterium 3-367]|uniref:DUF4199 domain-containing protein n=1 Tax=Eudoraea algarum TaxID=3417568 RepID=UPI0032763987
MKSTVIRFGALGFVLGLLLFLSGLYFGQGMDYSMGEVIGYATMIVSLIFVYFGIKHFRDRENGGQLSFGKGLTVGLLISLFTAAGVAIADYIYTTLINPDFFESYKAVMIAQGHTGELPDYGSASVAALMFLMVLIIGLIISLISALMLQRKN